MATAKDTTSSPPLPPAFVEEALPKAVADDLALGEGRAVFTSARGSQLSWLRPDRSGRTSPITCSKRCKGPTTSPATNSCASPT
jgi:hypothetical protein